MFPANTFAIRAATAADDTTLTRLAVLEQRPEISRPALIAEIDGLPAAAIAIADERIVADPFACPPQLRVQLRMHAAGLRAHERIPSVGRRIDERLPQAA